MKILNSIFKNFVNIQKSFISINSNNFILKNSSFSYLNFSSFGIFYLRNKMTILIENLIINYNIRFDTYKKIIESNLRESDKNYIKFENDKSKVKKDQGFFIILNSILRVTNITVKNTICINCSGGVFSLKESSIKMENSFFEMNIAENGGVINLKLINILDKINYIKNTIFKKNYAEIGGALYIYFFPIKLENLIFLNLKANFKAGD